jgi:hypothetical protein
MTVLATLGLALSTWWALRRDPLPEHAVYEQPAESSEAAEVQGPKPNDSRKSYRWLALALPAGLVLAYWIALAATGGSEAAWTEGLDDLNPAFDPARGTQLDESGSEIPDPPPFRLTFGIVILFLGLAWAASEPQPEADAYIVEAIHEEAPDARRQVLWELTFLLPAIALGIAGLMLMMLRDNFGETARVWLNWAPAGEWRPVWGLGTALTGWLIAGAIGWFVRIGFTLVLGKEAFGMGDVHILAATGAIAGWPVAFLGFFMASLLALLGMVVIYFRRQSRALPFGPWLALGFFVASVYQDRILNSFQVRWMLEQGQGG